MTTHQMTIKEEKKEKIIALLLLGLLLGGCSVRLPECVQSHVETQYEQPMVIVPQGTSIGIPMGKVKPIQVTVCDKYE